VAFTNAIQRNSKLLANLQVGSRNECNVDYVKNFGNQWGIYFRLFPYIKEHTLYTYNADHERMSSERSLEYGGTAGVGLFTKNAFIAEAYGYGFNSRTYRKIAEIDERQYHSAGIGFKLYREHLDDYLLPTRGVQLMTKLTTTMDIVDNTEDYKKYYLRTKVLVPVTPWLSCKGQFEYGSFFRKIDTTFDPFYLGGIDSYPGLQRQEMSAPIFRYGILALRFHKRSFVYDLFVGSMYLGNTDVWQPQKYRYHCIGMQIGLKSRILPVRSAWTMDEEWHSTIHLSVGFEIDPFSFSRR
jgi:outer membrane protein assembly factor BamA